MTCGRAPGAVKPGIHCARTQWNRGFMTFHGIRRRSEAGEERERVGAGAGGGQARARWGWRRRDDVGERWGLGAGRDIKAGETVARPRWP